MPQPVACTLAERGCRPSQGMKGATNVFLLTLAAASLVTASASAAPDDPIGDLIAHSLPASESPDGAHRWKSGERMGYDDWSSARSVDYRQHGLRPPPLGYEWRETSGQYVLAAASTGLIVAVALVR